MVQKINSDKKDEQLKVLIPINFDFLNTNYVNYPNSMSLLDIFINYAKDLYKCPFTITVLFLVEQYTDKTVQSVKTWFKSIKAHYEFQNMTLEILNMIAFIKAKPNDLFKINISENKVFAQKASDNKIQDFREYMELIDNSSTREDLLFSIYWDIIKSYVHSQNYEILLMGNSMNNIATKILSNIVKGKGLEITQILAESQNITLANDEKYNFKVMYPLKDVLNSEIMFYMEVLKLYNFLPSELKENFLTHKDDGKAINVKTATLNHLINDYFNELEKNGYSPIVSTVVSTGFRLDFPKEQLDQCAICKFKIPTSENKIATNWLNNITVNSSCDSDEVQQPDFADLGKYIPNVCYGCSLSFRTTGSDFLWPVERPSDQQILDEFIIHDDDDDDDDDEN